MEKFLRLAQLSAAIAECPMLQTLEPAHQLTLLLKFSHLPEMRLGYGQLIDFSAMVGNFEHH
jgi:hypothetical protein